MNDAVIQLGIAAFGLSALWMAMGQSTAQRKFAPIVGLIGQAFWIAFAWRSQAWGIAALVTAYTAVYLRGAWVQWKPRASAGNAGVAAVSPTQNNPVTRNGEPQ